MSGTLPTEIGLLQNLERMYLSKAMIGPLPTEMKNLTKLHTLCLPESFSAAGQVPDEVCALTNTSLTNLCQDSAELCSCCVFGSGSSSLRYLSCVFWREPSTSFLRKSQGLLFLFFYFPKIKSVFHTQFIDIEVTYFVESLIIVAILFFYFLTRS